MTPQRGVATALITIPGAVQRLNKPGYCAVLTAREIWQLTVTSNDPTVNNPASGLPVVFLSQIVNDI